MPFTWELLLEPRDEGKVREMSDNSQLEMIRETAKKPSYKQTVYVNAGQLLAEIEREYMPRDTTSVVVETGRDVKRPEPEVLDADGVPILVGDTVWFVQPESANYGNEYVVSHIGEDSLGKTVWFRGQCGAQAFGRPQYVTHKQPDSLERIEEDALMNAGDYCMEYDVDCLIGECEKAMRLDLLRRQREVLERDHER